MHNAHGVHMHAGLAGAVNDYIMRMGKVEDDLASNLL
jgi:hypothetical protein